MKVSAPPGTYPHGTNAKYVLEKCRCDECRKAVAAHRKRTSYLAATGRPGNVDAEMARAHVKALMRTGMGYKRIGEKAGINPKTVYILVAGRSERGTPPPKQIRRETAEKLLAVKPSYLPRQTIDALPFWNMVADLMGLGYSRAWISRALGNSGPALQIGKRYIHVKNAVAIKHLWESTAEPRTAENRFEQSAITRSKNASVALRRRLSKGRPPNPRSGRGTRRPDRAIAQ